MGPAVASPRIHVAVTDVMMGASLTRNWLLLGSMIYSQGPSVRGGLGSQRTVLLGPLSPMVMLPDQLLSAIVGGAWSCSGWAPTLPGEGQDGHQHRAAVLVWLNQTGALNHIGVWPACLFLRDEGGHSDSGAPPRTVSASLARVTC